MATDLLKSPERITTQLSERFKEEIVSGKYPADRPMPSFSALAERFGISKSTIHEAFKELAQEGFLFIKQGKGAFVNPKKIQKRGVLKLKDVAVIAFNVFSPNDNYMVPFLEAVHPLALDKKINLHYQFVRGMSLLSPENAFLREAIAERRYQGLLLASPLDTADLRWLHSLQMPFVAATSHYNLAIPQVLMDNALAARLAGDALVKRGARRLAVFTGPVSWQREKIVPYAREIVDEFTLLQERSGLSIDFVNCEYNYQDAKAKALAVCFNGKPYDAYFFQSDVIAKGVLAAFREKGADPSKLLTVNYFDHEEYIATLNIRKPLHELGSESFRLLEGVLSGKVKSETIRLKPELISKEKAHG
ncbi:MAG: GntR family transcriptional regulator [Fibrobacterota bacterium]